MAFDKAQLENLSNLLLSPEDVNTKVAFTILENQDCLLYTSPSPRDRG